MRRGPRVERETHAALASALDALERHARVAPRREAVEFVSRRYEPGDLVAARIELRGDGVRAGVDVRGDGRTVAWTGRFRRAEIAPARGETAIAALRRTLTAPPRDA